MKFKGRSSFHRKLKITVRYRDVGPSGEEVVQESTVSCRPLPFDFADTIARRLPAPYPPKKPLLKDGNQGAPVRDEQGRPVLVEDDRDARYLAQKAIHDRRMGIAAIVESVDPSDMSFETLPPAPAASAEVWGAYYDACFEEMKAAEMPIDLFRALSQEIGIASGVTKESVREGMKDFLPTPKTPNGETSSGPSSTLASVSG